LLVRHGESQGNLEGRLQGQRDYPLTARGESQARAVGRFLTRHGAPWKALYASPLTRALRTAELIAGAAGQRPPEVLDALTELGAGRLEGLDRHAIAEAHPEFLQRGLAGSGDFSAYGGESYDDIQGRVTRLRDELIDRHRASADRIVCVAHGGIAHQLTKALIAEPVPRVAALRWGNGTVTRVTLRERFGGYRGEVDWHLPLELVEALSTPEMPPGG
jgi:broad specificity phosphatase PhoE